MSSHDQESTRPLGDGSDASLQNVHADLTANKPEPKDGYSMLPLFLL